MLLFGSSLRICTFVSIVSLVVVVNRNRAVVVEFIKRIVAITAVAIDKVVAVVIKEVFVLVALKASFHFDVAAASST